MTKSYIVFGDGKRYPVNEDKPLFHVQALRMEPHGDWKTQSVRKEFMGIREGQTGVLTKVWWNYYGRWCTVRLDDTGESVDVSASCLRATHKLYEPTLYLCQETLEKKVKVKEPLELPG